MECGEAQATSFSPYHHQHQHGPSPSQFRMASLGVNLSSPAISQAYKQVIDGERDYLVLTYEKNSNDLRVQVCEKGDLDYLQEEFSDGRIQYAFARVKDPNTQLPKFVLINWCGEGVPENKK